MGFMGMADGGRIKVNVNCRGSAKCMRRKKNNAGIVESFCFESD